MLNVLCMASATASREPTRTYGLYIIAQLLTGVVGLAVLPDIFAAHGLFGYFVAIAILLLAITPTVVFFPGDRAAKPAADHLHDGTVAAARTGVFLLRFPAIFFFYVGIGAVWTFMGTVLDQAKMAEHAAGLLLSIATVGGVVGSAFAVLIGERFGSLGPLRVGLAILVFTPLLLLPSDNPLFLGVVVFLFKFAWTFALPYVFATLARIDTDGRVVAEISLCVGFGLASGPPLAGAIIQASGISAVMVTGAVVIALSAISVFLFERATRVRLI